MYQKYLSVHSSIVYTLLYLALWGWWEIGSTNDIELKQVSKGDPT